MQPKNIVHYEWDLLRVVSQLRVYYPVKSTLAKSATYPYGRMHLSIDCSSASIP